MGKKSIDTAADIVLELVSGGKITNDDAKLLLEAIYQDNTPSSFTPELDRDKVGKPDWTYDPHRTGNPDWTWYPNRIGTPYWSTTNTTGYYTGTPFDNTKKLING